MNDQQVSRFSVHRFYVLMYLLAAFVLGCVVYDRIQVVHEHVVPRVMLSGLVAYGIVVALIAAAHRLAVSISNKEIK